jgi:hypothetical protein
MSNNRVDNLGTCYNPIKNIAKTWFDNYKIMKNYKFVIAFEG